MSTQTRQPRGIPAGGEFAANAHDEAKPWADMSTDEHKGAVSEVILRTLAEHGIYDWSIRFSSARKTLGMAQFKLKEISISTLQFPSGRDATMDTAMHEVAHVIAGAEAGHGEKWKAVARRLGANPKASTSNVHIERELGSKTMKTRYGNVPVIEGETTFQYQGETFTVMEARNTKIVGESTSGKKFFFDADHLHENYGDVSKMTHGRTRQVKTDYGVIEATEGKTTFSVGNRNYTVIEINPKTIIGIDAAGRRLKTSVNRLHKVDQAMSEAWLRAGLRNAAKRSR